MNRMVLALFAFCALIVFSSAATTAKPKPDYTKKYDDIDLDQILSNDRLLEGYFKCLMDEGRCSPEGTELKKILPDALARKCSLCSEKQKRGSEKVIRYLIDKKPSMWDRLEKKYDPKGTYRKVYRADAEKIGIKVDLPKN